VLDSVHDGTWDWHIPSGRLQLSTTHVRLLGYAYEQLPATIDDWQRLVHPDDGADRTERLARLMAGETDSYETEYRVRTRDGGWKGMYVRGSVVERDADGRAVRAVGSHGDADRRKHAETAVQQALAVASVARAQAESLAASRARLVEELEAAHATAVESARLKSEFLANMSHEIRTPMNAIIGFSDLLLEMNLGETERDFALTVSTAAHSLLDVINDILDFSKIEAGRMQLDPRPFELRPLVEEVTEMLAPRAQAKGVDVAVDLPLGEPAWLEGDAVRVRQILVNLMGNAVKFTERGHSTRPAAAGGCSTWRIPASAFRRSSSSASSASSCRPTARTRGAMAVPASVSRSRASWRT
jgi:PAS domain S-box-containing protein